MLWISFPKLYLNSEKSEEKQFTTINLKLTNSGSFSVAKLFKRRKSQLSFLHRFIRGILAV